jgi:hypothetical protein
MLAGMAGGLGALAASALGRAPRVRAGVDGDVVLGAANSATSVTEIDQQTADTAALSLTAPGATPALTVASGAGVGSSPPDGTSIFGESTDLDGTAIWGQGASSEESSSLGVVGLGDTGVLGSGIFGIAGGAGALGIGIYGSASDEGFPDVFGATGLIGQADAGGTGVLGFTGATAPEPARDVGIYGRSDSGGTNGRGLVGFCGPGIGLLGQTTSGVGVRAFCGNNTGVGLRVTGKAAFDRSGKITIAAGSSSVTKTGIGLSSASFILATLQTYVSGLVVQSVVTNPAGSTFTIQLNKAPTVNVSVGWMAIN